MSDSGTEVRKASSAKADNVSGHDGGNLLRDYKIPKKARMSKYDYRELSDEECSDSTDPYALHTSEDEFSGLEGEGDLSTSQPQAGTSTSHRSEAHRKCEAVSDEESDYERFDPLDKSSDYVMTGSMERYVIRHFTTYLNENRIKDKVLEDAPVPENEIFNPPNIDDFIEDLIGNRKAWRFMKLHDNSLNLKFIQKKVAHI